MPSNAPFSIATSVNAEVAFIILHPAINPAMYEDRSESRADRRTEGNDMLRTEDKDTLIGSILL